MIAGFAHGTSPHTATDRHTSSNGNEVLILVLVTLVAAAVILIGLIILQKRAGQKIPAKNGNKEERNDNSL